MTTIASTLTWTEFGSCRGSDAALFYPAPEDKAAIERAKAICEMCLVRDLCRDYAMAVREPAGVWGGTDERERRRIWRREGRRLRY